jgi:hypothetical protein
VTGNEDPVSRLIRRANRLLDSSPKSSEVHALIADLTELTPRDLVRFDSQARSWSSGVDWAAVEKLRWPILRGARKPLWQALALVSSDGHERERAVEAAPVTVLGARLLVLRCLDWVPQVSEAALARVDELPHDMLVEALPLAEQLAAERQRGHLLEALLDARLSDENLRLACRADHVWVRRAAWRRLAARDALTARELREVAARDSDVAVRSVASRQLERLPVDERRALARVLVDDPVGSVAAQALAALVDMEGAPAIRRALTARSAAARRAAREWAAIHDVDARAVYGERVAQRPSDAIALIALAELADPRDAETFRRMLHDPRSRVRAAALRGLARVDDATGRAVAIEALERGVRGRVAWVAADVLRGASPSAPEADVLARVARDRTRGDGQRLRALTLLRPLRWLHLALVLEARQAAGAPALRRRLDMEVETWLHLSGHLGRPPDRALRDRIEALMGTLDDRRRRRIEFILRTSSS